MLRVRFRREARDAGGPLALPLPAGASHPRAPGFTGAAGQVASLGDPPLALVGLGPAPVPPRAFEEAGGRAVLAFPRARRIALDARGGHGPEAAARLAAGACLRAWRYDALRTRPDPERAVVGLDAVDVLADDPALAQAAWERAEPGVRGCLYARDLVAEPSNLLTPDAFAARLEALSGHGVRVEVWGRKRLAREGLGALLAVGGGSANPPRLAVLRWPGSGALEGAPPVALVGKGITFDTGGVCVKPAAGMEDMRADMAGAAACAGAMLALALRGSPAPAVAVLALAENALGAASYRPGDVLRTASGRTVEVVDTDAEGRLVLADALHVACARHRPRAVLDLATLTGSVVTALGHHRAGLFSNDDALASAVAAAGEAVGERVWPLPISERQRRDLDSAVADLRHCLPAGGGDGWGGRFMPDASHGAAFLREFVPEGVSWAHLDIAGVESREGGGDDAEADPRGPKGPTGFGARLLDRLVATHFEEEVGHP